MSVKKERATVSVAIIAKNEAATITPTIESVNGIVDEIIVLVDDTTTDNTFELAKKAGATVVEHYKWKDDFAGARNEAIEKCTKDWICIMDAHEVLHPNSREVLTNLMERVVPGGDLNDTDMFFAVIYMDPKGKTLETLVPETSLQQQRLFKNDKTIFYVSRVHNHLVRRTDSPCVSRPVNELVFIHKRTDENDTARRLQRKEMNICVLLEEIEKEPEKARNYFYLANTYYELHEWENAKKQYTDYLTHSEWKQERAQACLMLASIFIELKDLDTATNYALQGVNEDWMRAENYIMLGDIAFAQGDLYKAEHWYKCSLEMVPPYQSGMFLRGPAYTYLGYAKLAMLYSAEGVDDFFKALQMGEKSIDLGYPNDDLPNKILLWKQKMALNPDKPNLIIYDENGAFTFIKNLSTKLRESYNVATGIQYLHETAAWADVVWFEWCANNVVKATELPKPDNQKWVVRLHGYELYRPNIMSAINWDKVDVLIFVAEHVKKHCNELYIISDNVKQLVIPNGLDVKCWDFSDRSKMKSNTIGVVGILTEKKGPQLLGQTIRYFAKNHPDYKFLLRIDVPGAPSMSERALLHEIEGLTNWERVPKQESMNRFLEDVKYILSTSTLESFSYVIAEAMSKGIKPLVYNWIGASGVWPKNLIWNDFTSLDALLASNYESVKYRQYIDNNFSLKKQVKAVTKEIDSLIKGIVR